VHTSHITRQQRLHDQALDRANEQRCRRLVVKRGRQLAAGLAFLDETMQTFAVALNQGLHHALGRCRFGTLKLTKHHSWHAWVLSYEFDMTHEHRLHGCQGRLDSLCGSIDSG
jgi:hypothetical protein